MNFDLIVAVVSAAFSLGGAWFLVNRLKDDVKEIKDRDMKAQWDVITKIRDWQVNHEREASEQRLKFVQEVNRIERDSVTKDEMRRFEEKVYGKLDDLSEKMDRLIQSKGNSN